MNKDSKLVVFIKSIFYIFSYPFYLTTQSFNLFRTITIIQLGIILLYLFLCIFVIKTKVKLAGSFSNFYYVFLVMRYYVNINTLLMLLLNFRFEVGQRGFALYYFKDIPLFDPITLMIIGMNFLSCAILLILTYIKSFYEFDPFYDIKKHVCVKLPHFQPLVAFFHFFIVFSAVQIDSDKYLWEKYLIMILTSLINLFIGILKKQYVNQTIAKIHNSFWIFHLSLTLLFSLFSLLEIKQGLIGSFLIALLLVTYINVGEIKNPFLYSKNIEELDDEQDVIGHIISLLSILNTKINPKTVNELRNYTFMHSYNCKLKNCPLNEEKLFNKFTDYYELTKSVKNIFGDFLLFQIEERYRKAMKGKSQLILKVIILLFVKDEKFKASEFLDIIKKNKNQKGQVEFTIFCIEKVLLDNFFKEHQDDQNDQDLNLENNTFLVKNLEAAMERAIALNTSFWNLMKLDQPDYTQIIMTGKILLKIQGRMMNIIDAFPKIGSKELEIVLRYVDLLYKIQGQTEKGLEILKNINRNLKQPAESQSEFIVENPNEIELYSFPILIAKESENRIKIVKANEESGNLLGYTKTEISSLYLDELYPNVLTELKGYFLDLLKKDTGKQRSILKHFVLLQHAEGYLLPVILKFFRSEDSFSGNIHLIIQIYEMEEFSSSFIFLCEKNLNIINYNKEGLNFLNNFGNYAAISISDIFTNYSTKQDMIVKGKPVNFELDAVLFGEDDGSDKEVSLELFNYSSINSKCEINLFKVDNLDYYHPDTVMRLIPLNKSNFVLNDSCKLIHAVKNKIFELQELSLSRRHVGKSTAKFTMKSQLQGSQLKNSIKAKYKFKGISLLLLKNDRLYTVNPDQIGEEDIDDELDEEFERFQLDKQLDNKGESLEQDKNLMDKTKVLQNKKEYDDVLLKLQNNNHSRIIKGIMIAYCLISIAVLVFDLYQKIMLTKQNTIWLKEINSLDRSVNDFSYAGLGLFQAIMFNSYFKCNQTDFNVFSEELINFNKDVLEDIKESTIFLRETGETTNLSKLIIESRYLNKANEKTDLLSLHEILITKLIQLNNSYQIGNISDIGDVNEKTYFILANIILNYTKQVEKLIEGKEKQISYSVNSEIDGIQFIPLYIILISTVIFIILIPIFYSQITKRLRLIMGIFLKVPNGYIDEKKEEIEKLQINQSFSMSNTRKNTEENIDNEVFMIKKQFKNTVKIIPFNLIISLLSLTFIVGVFTFTSYNLKIRYFNVKVSMYQENKNFFNIERSFLKDTLDLPSRLTQIGIDVNEQQTDVKEESTNNLLSFYYNFLKNIGTKSELFIDSFTDIMLNDSCLDTLQYTEVEKQSCITFSEESRDKGMFTMLNEINESNKDFKRRFKETKLVNEMFVEFNRKSKFISKYTEV